MEWYGRARRTSGQGAADRGEYRQAAGAFAEAVIRSVELIVQPDAHDVVCNRPRGLPNKLRTKLVSQADRCGLRSHPQRVRHDERTGLGGQAASGARPYVSEVDCAEVGVAILSAHQPIPSEHGLDPAAQSPTSSCSRIVEHCRPERPTKEIDGRTGARAGSKNGLAIRGRPWGLPGRCCRYSTVKGKTAR